MLANLDLTNNIYISTSSSIAPGGSNTFTIEPLGTISISSASAWWAIADAPGGSNATGAPTPILAVMPGGTQWAPSPAQIADVIAPLAAAIATQIAQTGIPLIANPQGMYNISAPGSGGTGNGLFGASIKTGTGQTVLGNEQTWQNLVGRPVKTMKVYNAELKKGSSGNQWQTTATASITACMTLGARACLCYSPPIPSSTEPSPTTKANLVASIQALSTLLTGAGAPAPVVTLWQEPQVTRNGLTAATYKQLVQYYANTDANGTGIRAVAQLVYDGEGFHADEAVSFYPGTAFIDIIAVDSYCDDFKAGRSLDTWHQVDTTKPFGIWEAGNSAQGSIYTNQEITNYLVGANQTPPSVLSELTGILAGGGTVDAFMWYQDDTGGGSGVNVITSAADFRIPLLQQINDAITSTAPSPGLQINAGATVTLTPISPSAGGGYASAPGISYDIVINPVAGVGSTLPFLQVELFWHNVDVPGSLSISRQNFYIPLGATGTAGTVIQAQGPQSGVLVAVKVQNLDSVAAFLNFSMLSVSRQQANHRWYWSAGASVAVPSFNAPGTSTPVVVANGGTFAKVLATETVSLAAGAQKAFLCGMHTGDIWVRLQNTSNAFSLLLQEPVGDQAIVYHEDSTSTENDLLITAPRTPLVALVTNNSAGTASITFALIAKDP
jgi:hypothetical protein